MRKQGKLWEKQGIRRMRLWDKQRTMGENGIIREGRVMGRNEINGENGIMGVSEYYGREWNYGRE